MITFRSRSARIFWLVQISSEMWDYASPYNSVGEEESSCEIYFDKFVAFMHRLFEKWQELEVTHSLTVVFFSRTYLSSNKGIGQARKLSGSDCEGIPEARGDNGATRYASVDVCGRMYEVCKASPDLSVKLIYNADSFASARQRTIIKLLLRTRRQPIGIR